MAKLPKFAITSPATVKVPENSSAVMRVIANRPSSYSIVGGYDPAKFRIDNNTGDLSFTNQPDFEKPDDSNKNKIYIVQVQAVDRATQQKVSKTITITVTDVVESVTPPTPTPSTPWLANGKWNDAGSWNDTATWID